MRKFFSQKSKHKTHQHSTLSTLTGSSTTTTATTTTNKDDDTAFAKKSKSQSLSSQPQIITTNLSHESLIKSKSNESLPSDIKPEEEDSEKSKKLFVVVQGKTFLPERNNVSMQEEKIPFNRVRYSYVIVSSYATHIFNLFTFSFLHFRRRGFSQYIDENTPKTE